MGKHLIIVSYDGISTHYCGVGTIIKNTIAALNRIVEKGKFKISLAYIRTDMQGPVFNQYSYQNSLDLVQKSGGYLIPLYNGTRGLSESDMWKSFPNWEKACASLLKKLNHLLKEEDEHILMLHDTPFLFFSKFKNRLFSKKIQLFYIPHSTGINHCFGNASWRKQRIKHEHACFNLIQSDMQSHIVASGETFAQHLSSEYYVSIKKQNYLKNGLYFDFYKNELENIYLNSTLLKHGIEIADTSKIIFSWGRCSIAKGFKELLEVWEKVEKKLPDYYLILQTPNNSGEEEYYQELKHRSKKISRTVLIDDFNPLIWKTILRCENTAVVCIPSIMDPNPHTPMEAKLFSKGMNYVMVISNRDGVKDTFQENECLMLDPKDENAFLDTIIKAVSIDKMEIRKMNIKNSQTIQFYNYSENLGKFLKSYGYINE